MIQFFVFVLLILGSSSPVFAYNGNHAMEEADRYLRDGQYLEAVGAYQDIAELSPDSEMKAKAVLRMGDIYSYFLNNNEMALEKYALVINKYGSSVHAANAHFSSGMILYEKNRYEEALNEFKAYVSKYPRGDRRDTAEFMIEACLRPPPKVEEKKPPMRTVVRENIRVLLASGLMEVRVDSEAKFEVQDGRGKNVSASVRTAIISLSASGIGLAGNGPSYDGLVIVPAAGKLLNLNGTPYRGEFRIAKSAKAGMDVINVLDVEDYLYGVVPKEMSPQWHIEALKAQAVAARTYVLYQKEKSADKPYDVVSTTASQVYGGVGAEAASSSQAVDETRGKVLLYDGRLALAYFHANSGGMTEEASRVWSADVPYLKGVRDDYSAKAPGCLWKYSLNTGDIRAALNKKGLGIAEIERLTPADISPSGRVTRMKIAHDGKVSVLSGNDFRLTVDPTHVKSTMFTMTEEGEDVRLEGKGSGHGVGMSQWGAYIMAREGFSYVNILKHYYRGIELR